MKKLWWALLGAALLSGCEPRPLPPLIQFGRVSADPVTDGKRLASVLGCRGCHDKNLQGRDWSDPLGRLWTANLTRTTEQMDDKQLRRLLVTGARPDRPLWGMPSHLFTRLSPSDMAALFAYLRSVPPGGPVHPPPTFGPEARRLVAAGIWRSSAREVAEQGKMMPPDAGPEHLRGRYIVRATCAECHGMDLKGGRPEPAAKPRPDLRMVAAYSLPDFRILLRTGKAVGDREVGLMSEVSRGRFSHLTES